MIMYYRQIAAATGLYVGLALFGALAHIPAIGDDTGVRSEQAATAPAAAFILETEILHLQEEDIIP